MIKRRTILAGLLVGTALTACSGTNNSVAAWAQKATVLANGLAAIAPQLTSMVGIPQDIAATAQKGLQSAASFAAQLGSITDPAKALSVYQQVAGGLSAALAALQPFMALLPPPVAIALEAAQVLLPVIMALIEPTAPAAAVRSSMSPAQAELILQGIARK